MVRTVEGKLSAEGLRLAIVAARFNGCVVESLVEGALDVVRRTGGSEDAVTVFRVPGSFEIPQAARRAAASGAFDAVICLGVVIRGATAHFDYVAGEAAKGIGGVAATSDVPVIFGVLTTETIEQAVERAGTKAGNKGADAAFAALEMVDLYRKMAQLAPGAAARAAAR